jgi:hypothetical protein
LILYSHEGRVRAGDETTSSGMLHTASPLLYAITSFREINGSFLLV